MTLTVKELIKELKKCPQDSIVGFYPSNASNLGDAMWINKIRQVGMCTDKETVMLVRGFA